MRLTPSRSNPTGRNTRRRAGRAASGVVSALLLSGCITGFNDPDIAPIRVQISEDEETLALETSCGVGVQAEVNETDEAVEIVDLRGDSEASSCLEVLEFRLQEPLGGRAVYVQGVQWAECRSSVFVPPNSDYCI